MKKLVIVALALVAVNAHAIGVIQGYVQQGGQTVSTSVFVSTTKVQRSFPLATVTVYKTGTLTLAAIYSDISLTVKGNPFTAGSDGYYIFYTNETQVDIKFSGGGISTPFTIGYYTGAVVGGTFLTQADGDLRYPRKDVADTITGTWRMNGTYGIGRAAAPPVSLAIQQAAQGPIAAFDNGANSNYLHFTKTGNAASVDFGFLGSAEFNAAYNMNYADGTHKYYDSAQNAMWIAVNPTGFYIQYAPSGYGGGGDIWTNQGSPIPWQVGGSGNVTQTGILSLAAPASTSSYEQFSIGGTIKTIIGAAGANDSLVLGSLAGDTAVRAASQRILFTVDGGNNINTEITTGGILHTTHGLQLLTTISKPTCDSTQKGVFWYTGHTNGVKDAVEVCAADAANAYVWRPIY